MDNLENNVPEVKTFTQEDVNRIVQERIAREREKFQDYDDLKAMDKELELFGYQGTAKERREAIRAQREEYAKQAELAELQEKAKNSGTSPELLQEIREAKKEAKEAKEKLAAIEAEKQQRMNEINAKKQADDDWNNQVREFQSAYSDVDIEKLADNAKFIKFIKGKRLPLKELYEDFVEFTGEDEVAVKTKSKEERSTGSGKGINPSGKSSLSEEQRKTLNDWNSRNPGMQMSEKEFLSRY